MSGVPDGGRGHDGARSTFVTERLVVGAFPRGLSGPILGAADAREAAAIIRAGGTAVLPAGGFAAAADALLLLGASPEHVQTQIAMSRGELAGPADLDEMLPLHEPDPVAYPPCTVLVDDVRSFRDGRPCRVARSSKAALDLLRVLRVQRIEHLWLDHDLAGDDDVWPVVRALEDASLDGVPFDVGLVHVHAARSGPAHRVATALRRAGYAVERSLDLSLWAGRRP